METARGKTAIARTSMSRPLAMALGDTIVTPEMTVLDYGCGRGADVQALQIAGIACQGWDPVHRPQDGPSPADVVMLSYVINVIEDVGERADVVTHAWSLARRALIVATRLRQDASTMSLTPYADGWMTGRNTFQKFYEQAEARDWIEQVLGVPVTPAAPGLFYVFRSEGERQSFLANRVSRSRMARPRIDLRDLFEQHRELLEPLIDFILDHGRAPEADELLSADGIRQTFGSLTRAGRAVVEGIGEEAWMEARERRADDLLTYIALSRFSRRPRFGDLPIVLQRDVRALFGSYAAAVNSSDELLFSAGDMQLVRRACSVAPVGKMTSDALYLHFGALDLMPSVLRVYEGCARTLVGTVAGATLVKLRFDDPVVSYLVYPSFDTDAHPALSGSVVVPLQSFKVGFHDYSRRDNPPILHRKELFVTPDYPHRGKFERLTRQEERWGLYDEPERIGTKRGWEEKLAELGVRVAGHRLRRL